jgi:hypothetical protein
LSKPLLMMTALASVVAVTACAGKGNVNVISSSYADGVTHTEPVFYNDKHYAVTFRYIAGANAYDVTVAGKGGRSLGNKDGDQAIVESIAASTVRHFACANGQKSAIVAGTTRHGEGRWAMQARCA